MAARPGGAAAGRSVPGRTIWSERPAGQSQLEGQVSVHVGRGAPSATPTDEDDPGQGLRDDLRRDLPPVHDPPVPPVTSTSTRTSPGDPSASTLVSPFGNVGSSWSSLGTGTTRSSVTWVTPAAAPARRCPAPRRGRRRGRVFVTEGGAGGAIAGETVGVDGDGHGGRTESGLRTGAAPQDRRSGERHGHRGSEQRHAEPGGQAALDPGRVSVLVGGMAGTLTTVFHAGPADHAPCRDPEIIVD